jgi:monoamine oxidase
MRGSLTIWRALERARDLNLAARGEPPARPGPDGISRRRLLGALGAAAGALALPRLPTFAAAPARRVIVVGGGLAGLTALDRLTAAGMDATLYEARGAIGGRMRSVPNAFVPGLAVDEGAQLVNTDHLELIQLIGRLGLRLVDRQAYGAAEERHIGRDGRPVDEAALAEALRGIAARIGEDADRLDSAPDETAADIDRLSVAAYLDLHGLPPGDARDALEAGIRTEYGLEPEEASALQLLFNLPTVDCTRLTRLSDSDERYLVEGGTGRICEALAAPLAGRIRLGKRLAAIDLAAARPRLRFADGEEAEADRIILALPAPLLRTVRIDGPLCAAWRAFIAEADLGRNEKLMVGYEDQSWREEIGFGGGVWSGALFSAFWDARSGPPGTPTTPGALTYFLGGAQVDAAAAMENGALARACDARARAALRHLPAPAHGIRRTRWREDPLTRGAYAAFRPGQLTRFGHLLTRENEEEGTVHPSTSGALIFAGEWLSDAWQGYMNGALQTGRIAAETALAPAHAAAAA